MSHIAFFHTAQANADLFAPAVAHFAPDTQATHKVKPDLLSRASEAGEVTPEIVSDLSEALASLQRDGAGLIVCTCSTLGAVAEDCGKHLGLPVMRIDRPMAEQAVETAKNILVVACVKSTIEPTLSLLKAVADGQSKAINPRILLVEEAWRFFEEGDERAYWQVIAKRAREELRDAELVLLAQASMAGAADLCADFGVPVLSSPQLGVEAALLRVKASTGIVTPN